jgi:hypothetical protein
MLGQLTNMPTETLIDMACMILAVDCAENSAVRLFEPFTHKRGVVSTVIAL